MRLRKRNFQFEEDYWRLRTFLRDVTLRNDLQQLSWCAARLDYWRWHVAPITDQKQDEAAIFLWETPGGEIAAALNPEDKGEAFLQIHPDHQSPKLLDAMIESAEAHLYRTTEENKKRLVVWAHEHDSVREAVLAERGFQKLENPDWQERQRQRWLEQPLPGVKPAEGYTIRSLGGAEEIPSRSWASWRAFHPDSPDEDYQGWDWYPVNIQTQPMYRRDLDIVAIAPDGEVAAFTTLWYDDVTRCGYFEPVGTVPELQRKGLGKAVMVEGMRRIKEMGALAVSVSGFSVPANKLYAAVVSEDCLVNIPWVKEWEG
ncbi:MAG: GNAT family N-acetyltransferase [Anaerolineales bacterium]|jgi:GNAT superfamily N-acetyltransferase